MRHVKHEAPKKPNSKARLRKCHEGKKPYDSLREAQTAARCIVAKKAKSKNPTVACLEAYGCPCGKYHIGRNGGINWELLKELSQPVKLSEK